MSEWAAYCSEEDRGLVRRALPLLDQSASLTMASAADALRRMSAVSEPGELGIIVGPVNKGVSDVNLAAAIADGGNARCVALVCESATGSLRSRAARAGIDRVVDRAEVDEAEATRAEQKKDEKDGEKSEAARVDVPPEATPGASAPIVAFCSGRGGVGKTTVASCAAAVAGRWGLRTCLLDLDLSCGNAYAAFGLSRGADLAVLGRDGAASDLAARASVSAAPGVSLLGPCARPEMAEVVSPHLEGLLAWASQEFDLVVVDTSTTFTDVVAHVVQCADRVVLVSDDRSGSISAMARMSGLTVRLGVARTRIARLENRADPRSRRAPEPVLAGEGLEAARAYRLVDGGPEVDELVSAGRVTELCEPGYPFADALASLVAQLLAELGRLPEGEEARRAYERPRSRRGWRLFGQRREAS